jgi:deoxyribose-phosphate aldolase
MEINASNWLIYNKYDAAALVNEFSVEFDKASTGWSGEHETNTTKADNATLKTNRRSMW